MRKKLKTLLPDNVKAVVAFQGNQLSSCFIIKDKTKCLHKHDLFTMLNVLKKVAIMTMSAKRQDSILKGC